MLVNISIPYWGWWVEDCWRITRLSQSTFFFFINLFLYLSILQIFKTVTLEFSKDMPCIANVIPMIDIMHDNLLVACNNKPYSAPIHATLKIEMNLLNKYYSITDNSEIYQIAISMFNFIMFTTLNHLLINLFVSSSPIA